MVEGALVPHAQAQPSGAFKPGAVYKEYVRLMTENNDEWRVTDPNATHSGAQKFLPNPVLDIQINDLEHAVRAEVVIDRWGGHVGTVKHRVRFNRNEWIDIPLPETTPAGEPPESYLFHNNAVVQIPLDHLKEGKNTFRGTSGGQTYGDFGWGQWGWTGIRVRIYYNPAEKQGAPSGTITAPTPGTSLGENPEIRVSPSTDSVQRVDVLAHYRGVDEDGDGHFRDWHRGYFATRGTSDDMAIDGHCGTAVGSPWTVRWDTEHVPTQDSIRVLARLKAANGLWSVTDIVKDLSLRRADEHVHMIPAQEMPKNATSRKGEEKTAYLRIPPDFPLQSVTDADIYWRTWNGQDYQWSVDGHVRQFQGADHNLKRQFFDLPMQVLSTGRLPVRIKAETVHHGVEMLWPGPILVLRTAKE
jgi:hypothetical protein